MKLFQTIKDQACQISETIYNYCEEGKEDTEIAKINTFIRCGLFVLSVILISGIAVAYGQKKLQKDHIATSTQANMAATGASTYTKSTKKLPIYCVDTQKPQVALSFDAAWGNSRSLIKSSYYVLV